MATGLNNAAGAGSVIRTGRVEIDAHDGVAVIRLNRPEKMNAFDAEQIAAFESALRWFVETPKIRVGVLTGSGRAFCAGGDITTFDAIDVERGYPYTRRGYDILRSLEVSEKPMIAAVDGWCLAGGLEVALACDFIIAGNDARFGFGELARALELAASIAAQPELAVRIAATVARVVADGGDIEAALAAERIGGALLFGTQDAHHAVRTWSARGD